MAARGCSKPPGGSSLYNLLNVAHRKFTLVQTREWVDDLVQRIIGPVSRIQHHLEAVGYLYVRGLRDACFTVSPKTTWVTTDRGLSSRLMAAFRAAVFPVQCAASAADLGIGRGPCHPPSNSECSPPCQENLPTFQEPHERAHHQNAGHHGRAPLSHLPQQAVRNGSLAIGPSPHCHREPDHAQERRSLLVLSRWPSPWAKANLAYPLEWNSSALG